MKIRIGDYFDVYREGEETKRMIAISDSPLAGFKKNWCNAMTLTPVTYYMVDVDNEIESVIGNIINRN